MRGPLVEPDRLVVLDLDLEGASGLRAHRHKPEHAWEHFVDLTADRMPEPSRAPRGRLLALAG